MQEEEIKQEAGVDVNKTLQGAMSVEQRSNSQYHLNPSAVVSAYFAQNPDPRLMMGYNQQHNF